MTMVSRAPVSDRSLGTYRARLSGPDTAGGLRLIHEVTFTLGIMVERLGGIETRHRELGEWIDRWMHM